MGQTDEKVFCGALLINIIRLCHLNPKRPEPLFSSTTPFSNLKNLNRRFWLIIQRQNIWVYFQND